LGVLARLTTSERMADELILEGNSIDGIGAGVLSLALKTNETLMYIDLASNRIGVEGVQALAVAIMSNNTTSISTWRTIA